MTSATEKLSPGTVLADRYLIERVIGVGGMGAVYAARDQRFRETIRLCAVKEMFDALPDPKTRKRAIENFEREANILASLNHPAIPKVYDYFTDEERHYLVLEFIEGQNLAQYIRKRARPAAPARVIDWGIQLCDVLAHLHEEEPPIIFRDLKPSNIMLRPDGRIMLVDFGIAKHFQTSRKGTVIGTEGYAPPEQYEGEATPKVDIYALGATLHHLLTNTNPQEYRPFSYVSRPIEKYNATSPSELNEIIIKALCDDPEDRWRTARAMGTALKQLSEQDTVRATSPQSRTSLFDRLARSTPSRTQNASPTKTNTRTVDGGLRPVTPIWTFQCEEEVRSTPRLAEGRVYIGSYDYNLYCLDLENGAFRWKYATEGGIPGRPAVWGDLVIVGSEDGFVYGINRHSGNLAWTYATGGRVRSSPRIVNDRIIIGSDDGYVHALNVKRGNRLWRYETRAPVRSTAYCRDDTAFIGAEDGIIYALNLTTGDVRWRVRTNGAVTSSPAAFEDRIVCGSMDWVVYGLDASSGWVIWRFRTNERVVSSPFVHEGHVYVGSVDGHLYCLDAEWGKLVWKENIGSQVTSSPCVANEVVYCGTVDNALVCLTVKHGRLLWRFETDGPIPGSPRIADDRVVLGCMDTYVYALPVSPTS